MIDYISGDAPEQEQRVPEHGEEHGGEGGDRPLRPPGAHVPPQRGLRGHHRQLQGHRAEDHGGTQVRHKQLTRKS